MKVTSFDISASGMRAQRMRMDLIANNLANLDSTSARQEVVRTADGRRYMRHIPFSRKLAVFVPQMKDGQEWGVSVPRVVEDEAAFRAEHDPGHPHAVPGDSGAADAGTVYYPNVHPMAEIVDMISASRAYEANLTALQNFRAMSQAAMSILA